MSEKELINHNEDYSTNNLIADVVKLMLKYIISEEDNLTVEVGTFDNCREYGNTYRAIGAKQHYTFCIYEHRNSDEICINGCPTAEIKSYGPYTGKDKWFAHASFSYNQHYDAARQLYDFLMQSMAGIFVDKSK